MKIDENQRNPMKTGQVEYVYRIGSKFDEIVVVGVIS